MPIIITTLTSNKIYPIPTVQTCICLKILLILAYSNINSSHNINTTCLFNSSNLPQANSSSSTINTNRRISITKLCQKLIKDLVASSRCLCISNKLCKNPNLFTNIIKILHMYIILTSKCTFNLMA